MLTNGITTMSFSSFESPSPTLRRTCEACHNGRSKFPAFLGCFTRNSGAAKAPTDKHTCGRQHRTDNETTTAESANDTAKVIDGVQALTLTQPAHGLWQPPPRPSSGLWQPPASSSNGKINWLRGTPEDGKTSAAEATKSTIAEVPRPEEEVI